MEVDVYKPIIANVTALRNFGVMSTNLTYEKYVLK
jgi:hypothetical protein